MGVLLIPRVTSPAPDAEVAFPELIHAVRAADGRSCIPSDNMQ